MLYGLKIALRYLTASKGQTALLLAGVSVGVFIFIFMSALIGGLAQFITSRTSGDLSHISIVAEDVLPAQLDPAAPGVLLAQIPGFSHTDQLSTATAFVPGIEVLPGVQAVSPQVTGSGFLRRGTKVGQVSIVGLEPGRESAIVNLQSYLVAGTVDLAAGSILMGLKGADKLGLSIGQSVHLQSADGTPAILTLTGTYDMGSGGFDLGQTYVSLPTARILFKKPQGLSRIEIKLDDIFTADAITARIEAMTGLDASSWTESFPQLLDALAAQAQVGLVLKTFALITIVIGVASAMLLSSFRRRPEIGIMRAMGAGQVFVVYIFLLQGALIGIVGAVLGAGLGYAVLSLFPAVADAKPGSLPIDVQQGAYGMAVLLTTIGAILASILPARGAARVDPVTAIGQ